MNTYQVTCKYLNSGNSYILKSNIGLAEANLLAFVSRGKVRFARCDIVVEWIKGA